MNIINKDIKENGLAKLLKKQHYSDILFKIEDQLIESIKSIMSYNNIMIRDLIKLNENEKIIILPKAVTIVGFEILEKYYSGGNITINDDNENDLFITCITLCEYELLNNCIEYMRFHLNVPLLCDYLKFYNSNLFSSKLYSIWNDVQKYILDNPATFFGSKELVEVDGIDINVFFAIISIPGLIFPSNIFIENVINDFFVNKIDNEKYSINYFILDGDEIAEELDKCVDFLSFENSQYTLLNLSFIKENGLLDIIIRNYKNILINEVCLSGIYYLL